MKFAPKEKISYVDYLDDLIYYTNIVSEKLFTKATYSALILYKWFSWHP